MSWHDLDDKRLPAAGVAFHLTAEPVEVGAYLFNGVEWHEFSVNYGVLGVQDSEVDLYGQLFKGYISNTYTDLHLHR